MTDRTLKRYKMVFEFCHVLVICFKSMPNDDLFSPIVFLGH